MAYIYVGPFGMPEEDARVQYGDTVVDAAIAGPTTLDNETVTVEPNEEYQPDDDKKRGLLSW